MMEAKLLEGRCGEIITAVEARLDRQGRDGTSIAATLATMAEVVLRSYREACESEGLGNMVLLGGEAFARQYLADKLARHAVEAFVITMGLAGLDETDLGWLFEDYKAVLNAMAEDGLLRR